MEDSNVIKQYFEGENSEDFDSNVEELLLQSINVQEQLKSYSESKENSLEKRRAKTFEIFLAEQTNSYKPTEEENKEFLYLYENDSEFRKLVANGIAKNDDNKVVHINSTERNKTKPILAMASVILFLIALTSISWINNYQMQEEISMIEKAIDLTVGEEMEISNDLRLKYLDSLANQSTVLKIHFTGYGTKNGSFNKLAKILTYKEKIEKLNEENKDLTQEIAEQTLKADSLKEKYFDKIDQRKLLAEYQNKYSKEIKNLQNEIEKREYELQIEKGAFELCDNFQDIALKGEKQDSTAQEELVFAKKTKNILQWDYDSNIEEIVIYKGNDDIFPVHKFKIINDSILALPELNYGLYIIQKNYSNGASPKKNQLSIMHPEFMNEVILDAIK